MKPFIIGLNNPLSSRPRDALVPWPGQCAGARLVDMAHEVDPTFDATEYMDSFERRNVWGGTVAPKGKGSERLWRVAASKIRREIERENPRAVICLGAKVAALIGTVRQWQTFTCFGMNGRTYWYVPHPSGLCRAYNDPANRARCGRIVVSVARERLAVVGRS